MTSKLGTSVQARDSKCWDEGATTRLEASWQDTRVMTWNGVSKILSCFLGDVQKAAAAPKHQSSKSICPLLTIVLLFSPYVTSHKPKLLMKIPLVLVHTYAFGGSRHLMDQPSKAGLLDKYLWHPIHHFWTLAWEACHKQVSCLFMSKSPYLISKRQLFLL